MTQFSTLDCVNTETNIMGSVTIDGLMEGFSSLLHHANPDAIPQFMEWVDKKVSAYRQSSSNGMKTIGFIEYIVM